MPGLGKKWNDVNARSARISDALIPSSVPSDYEPEDLPQDYVLIPRADRTRPDNAIPEGFKPLDESEYEVYPVERVVPDRDPTLWGQGPNRSTRVASHKFVPYGRLLNRASGSQTEVVAGIKYGTVYVKFQNNGNVWRYDHVPDHIYQNFRNSSSKGAFINQFLNKYSYGQALNDSNASDL